MRVLLVQAPTYNPEMEGPIYPLGLAYLRDALEPAHRVHIVDLNIGGDGEARLLRALDEFEPDVLGYSMRNIKVSRPGSPRWWQWAGNWEWTSTSAMSHSAKEMDR